MIPAVFGKLKDSGFFFDPIARDIEINFMPNLLAKVKSKVRAKLGEKRSKCWTVCKKITVYIFYWQSLWLSSIL